MLGEHGLDYETREFFKEPFTRNELESLLQRAKLNPSELVSTRSGPYRNEKLADKTISEDEWIDRMLAEPRLIRRPILVTDDGVYVGFDRAWYEQRAAELAG